MKQNNKILTIQKIDEEHKEQAYADAAKMFSEMFAMFSHIASPGRQDLINEVEAQLLHICANPPDDESSEDDIDYSPVKDHMLPCISSHNPQPGLPVLVGAKARKEIRSVVFGDEADSVVTSMGSVLLPKDVPYIVTPVSSISFPVVTPVVDNAFIQLTMVDQQHDSLEPAFANWGYGIGKEVKTFKPSLTDCDAVLDNLEHRIPVFRQDHEGAYTHIRDPGRFSPSDIDIHNRKYAIRRIIDKMPSDSRIGIFCRSEADYVRLDEMYPDRVYYPIGNQMVDIVLVEPFGRTTEFFYGWSPREQFLNACAQYASIWTNVKHYVVHVNNMKFAQNSPDDVIYSLYLTSHSKSRFFVTNVPDKLKLVDMIYFPAGKNMKKDYLSTYRVKLKRLVAFLLAVSSRRNFMISPQGTAARKYWSVRGGILDPLKIYAEFDPDYLNQAVDISSRKYRGFDKGVMAQVDMISALRDKFGEGLFSHVSLLNEGYSTPIIRRLIMLGHIIPDHSLGTVMYSLPRPVTEVSICVPIYPPTVVFKDSIIGSEVSPIVNVLPVPMSLNKLIASMSGAYEDRSFVLYSRGAEDRHVIN